MNRLTPLPYLMTVSVADAFRALAEALSALHAAEVRLKETQDAYDKAQRLYVETRDEWEKVGKATSIAREALYDAIAESVRANA